MYKIAVIGDHDSIYGFAALGLDTFPVADAKQAGDILHQLAQTGYGIIYLTEALAAELKQEVEYYREQLLPAVVLIPGISGNTGEGIAQVKKTVEQAVGSDILFGGNEKGGGRSSEQGND
ncbi:MAG: V-type ATP synthase subunit F [Oscillospiraceae bacterium]|jgi:V/A-type H+-transporting ATPase subunit F